MTTNERTAISALTTELIEFDHTSNQKIPALRRLLGRYQQLACSTDDVRPLLSRLDIIERSGDSRTMDEVYKTIKEDFLYTLDRTYLLLTSRREQQTAEWEAR